MSMGHAAAVLGSVARRKNEAAAFVLSAAAVFVRNFIPRVPATVVAHDNGQVWVRWPNGVTAIVAISDLEPAPALQDDPVASGGSGIVT